MRLLLKYSLFVVAFFCFASIFGQQSRFFLKANTSKKIHFQFVGNLIIIPVEINGVTLSFVLDSGANKPILFNLTESDSLEIRNTKTIFLQGLGSDGKIEALKSSNNTFKIGNATKPQEDLYVLLDSNINFTPRLGVVVHGIIGYSLFKDFVVEINYSSKYIRLHKPNTFKPKTSKKWKTLPIEVINNKPFVNANVSLNQTNQNVKLLIDTGSSDALWLFENQSKKLYPKPEQMFYDFLGKGLSGSVYGNRSKIEAFSLANYNLNNVNVAYPDASALEPAKIIKGRNGSVGAGVLKRFNVFLDYKAKQIHLKKNSNFKLPFTYNNSGIVLEYNGVRYVKEVLRFKNNQIGENHITNSGNSVQINTSVNYVISPKPVYVIAEVRPSSNAYKVGLRVNDVLIELNGKKAYAYNYSEITKILHGKIGKTIRLKIERFGIEYAYKFKLDNVFKPKEPLN